MEKLMEEEMVITMVVIMVEEGVEVVVPNVTIVEDRVVEGVIFTIIILPIFHSLQEEQSYVQNRRDKRIARKSLFDVEPTEEQALLEDVRKAAFAAGVNSGGSFRNNKGGGGGGIVGGDSGGGGGMEEGGGMYGPADQGLEQSRSTNNNTSSSSNPRSSNRGNNERSSSNRRSGDNRSSSNNNNVLRHPQQTRHARRLYIGHLPADLSEQDVHHFFRDCVISATTVVLPSSFSGISEKEKIQKEKEDPILSVYINRERRFAFVEFRSVDICTACLQLDGIDILSKGKVKVKRPNDYDPVLAADDNLHNNEDAAAGTIMGDGSILAFDVSRLGVVSTTVADGPNKIFVGGLPYHLKDS